MRAGQTIKHPDLVKARENKGKISWKITIENANGINRLQERRLIDGEKLKTESFLSVFFLFHFVLVSKSSSNFVLLCSNTSTHLSSKDEGKISTAKHKNEIFYDIIEALQIFRHHQFLRRCNIITVKENSIQLNAMKTSTSIFKKFFFSPSDNAVKTNDNFLSEEVFVRFWIIVAENHRDRRRQSS